MKIICLVKFVPDLKNYEYDGQTDVINREKSRLILNPDDKQALAWALQQKKLDPTLLVTVVSMGPAKLAAELKDFVRLGADQAVLISDRKFAGCDSLATSLVLAAYLKQQVYDLILTGTHTLDGGTGHIAPQVAELLEIDQFSNISAIEELMAEHVIVTAQQEGQQLQLKLKNPSIVSVVSQLKARLGFVRSENIDKNVDSQFSLVTNETLALSTDLIGRRGSPTKVRQNRLVKSEKSEEKVKQVVKADEAGIEAVVSFLQEKGYV